jgi:hypothetical protein
MAHDAILVQDWRNILAIGDFLSGRRPLVSGFKQQSARTRQAKNCDHSAQTHLAPFTQAIYPQNSGDKIILHLETLETPNMESRNSG